MKELCNRIIRVLKTMMDVSYIYRRLIKIRYFNSFKTTIFFISTPIHGNLGDQAIVKAQYQLIEKIGGEKNIIEITRPIYEKLSGFLKRVIKDKDMIVIDGGGNIGTLWIEEEHKMQDIIKRFPKNPIFIFPQTAYFEESEFGKKELERSIEVYNAHRQLTIFCRDTKTYELIHEKFTQVKSFYTPDIVLYINNAQKESKRENVLLCLRNDLEKTTSSTLVENIQSFLKKKGYYSSLTSTLVDRKVKRYNRSKELDQKWLEFSSAKLVITDRLHGMIFCAITGTPCIALDNVSHKVRGGYQWIRYLPYIVFVEKEEEIYEKFDTLDLSRHYHYDKSPLSSYYDVIEEEVRKCFQ